MSNTPFSRDLHHFARTVLGSVLVAAAAMAPAIGLAESRNPINEAGGLIDRSVVVYYDAEGEAGLYVPRSDHLGAGDRYLLGLLRSGLPITDEVLPGGQNLARVSATR